MEGRRGKTEGRKVGKDCKQGGWGKMKGRKVGKDGTKERNGGGRKEGGER
jgi:hypothetical protein